MPTSTLKDQCASLVLNLNQRLVDTQNGSLIQVWLPEHNGNAKTVLSTQGLPYAVSGIGDLLALFRCISCRFSFSTDIMQPRLLGAIGRVYTSSELEICTDVQTYDKKIYLRVNEAQRCRVHATVVVPFFEPTARHRVLGVIEVVRNDRDTSFHQLLQEIIVSLESVRLCTSDINPNHIREGLKQWPAAADLQLLDFNLDYFGSDDQNLFEHNSTKPPIDHQQFHELRNEANPSNQNSAQLVPLADYFNGVTPNGMGRPHTFVGANAVGIPASSFYQTNLSAIDNSFSPYPLINYPAYCSSSSLPLPLSTHHQETSFFQIPEKDVPGLIGMAHMNAGSVFQAIAPMASAADGNGMPMGDETQILDKNKLEELLHVLTGNKHRKRKRGKMGSGKHLTYKDLQTYFKLGLKEAAARLGICPTTLKRACRRNGIKRWPSRHVAKVGTGESPDRVLEEKTVSKGEEEDEEDDDDDETENVDVYDTDHHVNTFSRQEKLKSNNRKQKSCSFKEQEKAGRLLETLRSVDGSLEKNPSNRELQTSNSCLTSPAVSQRERKDESD